MYLYDNLHSSQDLYTSFFPFQSTDYSIDQPVHSFYTLNKFDLFHHSILGFSKLIFSAKLYIVNPLFQRQQIWTNCELPKNTLQKRFFQNILKNSCKNWLAKPLFMRVPRGKCRNEGRPFQGIDTGNHQMPLF